MGDGAEAAIKGLIRKDIEAISKLQSKAKVTLADRMTITRILLHKSGLDDALHAVQSYSEITRPADRR